MHLLRRLIASSSLALAALAPSHAQAAGSVQVNFDKPDTYADVGRTVWDQERNVQLLREHLLGYAARLPAGQSLKVEVLDVDLAGEVRPLRAEQIRVMNGRVDWPRIQLRWSLNAGDRVLKSGDERLSDMSYLHSIRGIDRGQPLVYENRMLDRWFSERVAGAAAP